jgi:hypothetical protein
MERRTTTGTLFGTLLIAVLATGPNAQAQTQANTAGIKAGLNWTNLRGGGADVTDENARIGFHAGVFGRVAPSDAIGIQAELLYSTKGSTYTYNGLLLDQEVSFNLGYIELPIFLAIRLADVLEVHAGGYAGYLLSSNVSTSGDLGAGSEALDRDNFNSMDYGLLGGVGVNVGPAQIGVRYLHGLGELASSDGARVVLGDARNSAGQVYLAIGLGGNN